MPNFCSCVFAQKYRLSRDSTRPAGIIVVVCAQQSLRSATSIVVLQRLARMAQHLGLYSPVPLELAYYRYRQKATSMQLLKLFPQFVPISHLTTVMDVRLTFKYVL